MSMKATVEFRNFINKSLLVSGHAIVREVCFLDNSPELEHCGKFGGIAHG